MRSNPSTPSIDIRDALLGQSGIYQMFPEKSFALNRAGLEKIEKFLNDNSDVSPDVLQHIFSKIQKKPFLQDEARNFWEHNFLEHFKRKRAFFVGLLQSVPNSELLIENDNFYRLMTDWSLGNRTVNFFDFVPLFDPTMAEKANAFKALAQNYPVTGAGGGSLHQSSLFFRTDKRYHGALDKLLRKAGNFKNEIVSKLHSLDNKDSNVYRNLLGCVAQDQDGDLQYWVKLIYSNQLMIPKSHSVGGLLEKSRRAHDTVLPFLFQKDGALHDDIVLDVLRDYLGNELSFARSYIAHYKNKEKLLSHLPRDGFYDIDDVFLKTLSLTKYTVDATFPFWDEDPVLRDTKSRLAVEFFPAALNFFGFDFDVETLPKIKNTRGSLTREETLEATEFFSSGSIQDNSELLLQKILFLAPDKHLIRINESEDFPANYHDAWNVLKETRFATKERLVTSNVILKMAGPHKEFFKKFYQSVNIDFSGQSHHRVNGYFLDVLMESSSDKVLSIIKANTFSKDGVTRDHFKTFFRLIDESWNIHNLKDLYGSSYLKNRTIQSDFYKTISASEFFREVSVDAMKSILDKCLTKSPKPLSKDSLLDGKLLDGKKNENSPAPTVLKI